LRDRRWKGTRTKVMFMYERVRERVKILLFQVFIPLLLAGQISLVITFFCDRQFLIGLSVLLFTFIIIVLWSFVLSLSEIIDEDRRDNKEAENTKLHG
jgi:hypothetical protein